MLVVGSLIAFALMIAIWAALPGGADQTVE